MKHTETNKDTSFSGLTEDEMNAISKHVKKYIGDFDKVFHEMISSSLHIDLIHVEPSDKLPYNVLITMGASKFKMPVPSELQEFAHAEYVMFLPKDWEMSIEKLQDEKHYWPMRLLKETSRFPQIFNTWFYYGHTFPNGDPAKPYHESTRLSGTLITMPWIIERPDFLKLKVANKTIVFWAVVPLYESEWEYKLKQGTEALESLGQKKNINFCVINPTRDSIV